VGDGSDEDTSELGFIIDSFLCLLVVSVAVSCFLDAYFDVWREGSLILCVLLRCCSALEGGSVLIYQRVEVGSLWVSQS
jgi:hypothetical protein